ncbi:hypothetical protein Ddc_04300 [Ditylenchus destructor]|nr:hypothetical protein Ddc_04300 [Ditylenchus destructor]
MPCNPCCCWKLKDAAVTIGIWSTIYALASLAMFTWQWGVLSQCRHVTMAQSNLQCEYYCPCVGASTARTSALVEGLFVIQILCLIASFFLLFASIMLIYGWSRYLVWPWFICMASSILTSLAYCIMWWAGDVRDYWLVLTILEIFSVFLNCYCFVVICVFYKNMLIELEYYEGKRAAKYDRFSQRDTPQHTIEQDIDDDDNGGPDLRYPAAQYDWRSGTYPMTDSKYPPDPMPRYPGPYTQTYPQPYQPIQQPQRSPYFPQKFDHTGIPRDPNLPSLGALDERPIQHNSTTFEMFHAKSIGDRVDTDPLAGTVNRIHTVATTITDTIGGVLDHTGIIITKGHILLTPIPQPSMRQEQSLIHHGSTQNIGISRLLEEKKNLRRILRMTAIRWRQNLDEMVAKDVLLTESQLGNARKKVPKSKLVKKRKSSPLLELNCRHLHFTPLQELLEGLLFLSALDSTAERKYQIQSEITISYDPKAQHSSSEPVHQSLISPPEHVGGSSSQPSATSSVHRRPTGQLHIPTPMSIMSNV